MNDATVERMVADALHASGPVVLAVSGGRDSMALLHVAARVAARQVATVATFDHGTGSKASEAVALVAHRASALGLFCVAGRAPAGTPPTEAAWRAARWRFLRDAAAQQGGAVVTAHTEDDQLETIVMRILRHAGARGLAGLSADSDVVRPWLGISRRIVHSYAAKHGIAYVEDPSNRARTHLRNRVRLDLLPALRRVRPTLDRELLTIAGAAADWRRGIERLVAGTHVMHRGADGVSVAAVDLDRYDGPALAIVWPVLAARADWACPV